MLNRWNFLKTGFYEGINLDCKSATSLELQYRLNAFGIDQKSPPERASALYHRTQRSLWITYPNGQLPLAPLARELAIALCPAEDPGLFAAGLKEVIAADTRASAAEILDELGFSQLDTTVVEAPRSQEAEHRLGTETPIGKSDESQPDVALIDEIETLAESESPTTEDRPRRRGREFVSYVAVSPEDDERPEPDGLIHQERMILEDKAIELILKQEPELKRMPMNNPGFDLTELAPTGQPVKWVEVKAMSGTLSDRSVTLTRTQFDCAQEHGDAYWLYVVENAGSREESRLVRIRNPAGKAQTFTFDHGWMDVAEDSTVLSPGNLE